MRLVRLAALIGSLLLLVGTTVSLINRRAENRTDQIARVEAAAGISSVAVRASVESARSSVEIAGIAAVIDGVDRALVAAELVERFDNSEACVGISVADCTGADLFALAVMGDLAVLATADSESAFVAIDATTESVVVIERPPSGQSAISVILRIPIQSLIHDDVRSVATVGGVSVDLRGASRGTDDDQSAPSIVDGRRVIEASIGSIFADGSVTIESSIDGRVGLAGGSPLLYGALLAMGTALLGLAGWTFLVERRSLERRASTDELTGLVNRREFERISDEALDLADRFSTGLCVMVIDLNGFKQVNDTLGHQFGDLVLQATSERLVSAVRDTDVVGRWGGDEFVVLLPGLVERTAVRNSAERLTRTLAESPVVGDTLMTASIGAAIFPRHGTTLDTLMRAADVAMYGAKTTGVSHRIADTIATQTDRLAEQGIEHVPTQVPAAAPTIGSEHDHYGGPNRRRSPVPPPPASGTASVVQIARPDSTTSGGGNRAVSSAPPPPPKPPPPPPAPPGVFVSTPGTDDDER